MLASRVARASAKGRS